MATSGQPGSSTGTGGAGLKLRVPPDVFVGANEAAAVAARNAGLDAGDLAEFDVDPNLAIILQIGGADVFQHRRGGNWRSITHVVRGPGPSADQVLSEANLRPLLTRLGVPYV